MNDIVKTDIHLPDTLEDLTQFILVGKAKLNAYMIKLQSVRRLSVAQEIRDQTLQEAQEVSTALIAAEQRIGELLLTIPKATPNNNPFHENPNSGKLVKTKSETIKEMGYGKNEAADYQQMAKNPEVVQRVISDALENGDVVTKTQVMREIRALKEELRREREKTPEVKTIVKEVVPGDYREAKNKAKAYDAETKRLNQKLTEAYNKRNELEEEIRYLQEQTVREQANNDFIAGAIYFIAQCGSFIRDVGGYVWIADKLADLPEKDREGYIKAAMAVRDWASVLLNNIERSEYGKQEIERISSESN